MPQLTEDQQKIVQDILSKYDSKNLTNDDAKSIFQAFKYAGNKGPGLRDAIASAGYDPEKLRSMANPDWLPRPPEPPSNGNSGNGLNVTALKTLQSILSQFDLSNLSADKEQDLEKLLEQSGLMKPGKVMDLSA